MKFLTSGKVKDIYEVDDEHLLFRFSDRVSAFDVQFKEPIPKKGEVLCKFAEFWFKQLPISNHFVKRKSSTEIIVKKMTMIPLECVVRGYYYGSLVNRVDNKEIKLPFDYVPKLAEKLPTPFFDPTTKAKHDMPVSMQQAIELNLVTHDEYNWLSTNSILIYNQMHQIAEKAGFILADLKLEFGKLNGEILLGDSIGPDEYRLWLKNDYKVGKRQEAYDKQILRDWLTKNGYKKKFDEARKLGKEPSPPTIPSEIIDKMTQRYVFAYERMTGQTL